MQSGPVRSGPVRFDHMKSNEMEMETGCTEYRKSMDQSEDEDDQVIA